MTGGPPPLYLDDGPGDHNPILPHGAVHGVEDLVVTLRHTPVVFFYFLGSIKFLPQKISPLRGDFYLQKNVRRFAAIFFSLVDRFYYENTYRTAPQAIFFGYQASNIAISFIKFDKNAEFLPKFHINSQNIYGIFGAGLKISPIYMEIPYIYYIEKTTLVARTESQRS